MARAKQGKKKRFRTVVSITVPPELLERLDKLAERQQLNRSKVTELLLTGALEDSEQMMMALQNPALRAGLAEFLKDRQTVQALAKYVKQEMTDKQLDMFPVVVEQLLGPGKKKKG